MPLHFELSLPILNAQYYISNGLRSSMLRLTLIIARLSANREDYSFMRKLRIWSIPVLNATNES